MAYLEEFQGHDIFKLVSNQGSPFLKQWILCYRVMLPPEKWFVIHRGVWEERVYPVISQYAESYFSHNGINIHLPSAVLDLTKPRHDLRGDCSRNLVAFCKSSREGFHRNRRMLHWEWYKKIKHEFEKCVKVWWGYRSKFIYVFVFIYN